MSQSQVILTDTVSLVFEVMCFQITILRNVYLDASQNNTYVNDHFVFEAACKIVQDTIKHSQAEQRKYGEKRKTK